MGAIVGSAVGGIIIGLLVATLGVYVLRRRRTGPAGTRAAFEIEPQLAAASTTQAPTVVAVSQVQEATPFLSSAAALPPPIPPAFTRPRPASRARPHLPDKAPESSNSAASTGSPPPTLSVANPAPSSTSAHHYTAAEHEEDDEFATRKLLPPMYKSEWGEEQQVGSTKDGSRSRAS